MIHNAHQQQLRKTINDIVIAILKSSTTQRKNIVSHTKFFGLTYEMESTTFKAEFNNVC